MITDEELAAIRARAEAATPGPWHVDETTSWGIISDANGEAVVRETAYPIDRNAAFIAAARTDIPRLLDEVERLRAAVEQARTDEREECAKIGDVHGESRIMRWRTGARVVAAAIRARGVKPLEAKR